MMKAIALGNNFLLTVIVSSFLCWLASLHFSLLHFVQALFALKLVVSISGWILEDALVALLKINLIQLRFRLVASTIGALVGVGVLLCRS